jgi:hypothetical protein
MFYERSIDRLDPFAEDAAFRELAVMGEGSWTLVEKVPEQFWTYDEDRLVELAGRADAPAISFVAQAIIDRNAERLPEQLLVDEAKQDPPDPEKLDLIIGRIRDERGEPDIGFLKLAHLHLNNGGHAWSARAQIVQIIADNWRREGAVHALCDMLIPGGARDTRAEVRLIALGALHQAALLENDRSAQQAIKYCAVKGNEASNKVSSAAEEMLRQNPSWRGAQEGPAATD